MIGGLRWDNGVYFHYRIYTTFKLMTKILSRLLKKTLLQNLPIYHTTEWLLIKKNIYYLFSYLWPSCIFCATKYSQKYAEITKFQCQRRYIISPPWIWNGVSGTLQSGRYNLSNPRGPFIINCNIIFTGTHYRNIIAIIGLDVPKEVL